MKKRIGILTSTMSSYFVKRVAVGIEAALPPDGVELKIYEMQGKTEAEYHRSIEDIASEENLSGLIYGHLKLSANQVSRFKMRGIPVVAVAERMPGLDWVAVDEIQAAALATRHLLELGHRRLALLNGPLQAAQMRMREQGFLGALAEFGIEFGRDKAVRVLSYTQEEAGEAAKLLMQLEEPPTAIFVAAGDVAALRVLAALRELNLDVPSQVSVVGFDNLDFARHIYPKLSTINQPLEEMGSWAMKCLLERMQDPYAHKPYALVLEPNLVMRESAAQIEAAASLLEGVVGFSG